MSQEIIEMARRAGIVFDDDAAPFYERFARLAAAKEREACAKIVESNADACRSDGVAQTYLYSNAAAIRSRGEEQQVAA